MYLAQLNSDCQKVIHFKISKALVHEEVVALIDQIEVLSEDINCSIYLLGEFYDFQGFCSFRALWKMTKTHFAELGCLKKFALIAQKEWIGKTGSFIDFFTPGLDLQLFEPQEHVYALEWLGINEAQHNTL